MRAGYWILIIVGIVAVLLIWKFRYKIKPLQGIVNAGVPKSFTRKLKGGTFGSDFWENIDGKYYYTPDYGIMANIRQETTLQKFIDAYRS